jgi:hypothetical protein
MRDRYSIAVGLIFLALIAVATIHTLTGGGGEDTLGLDKQQARWPLPEFAVPAASGQLEGDANVYQDDCGSSSLPCSEQPPRVPACRIATAGAIRVCDLFDRPLVISFWFGTENRCEHQQGVVSAVAGRYRGRVNFLSLDVLDSRESVGELVRERGWKMPVGFDRDGVVSPPRRSTGSPSARPSPTPIPAGRCRAPASANLASGG